MQEGYSLGSKHFGCRYTHKHKTLWEPLYCEHQVSQFKIENVSLAPSLVCIKILQELKKNRGKKKKKEV